MFRDHTFVIYVTLPKLLGKRSLGSDTLSSGIEKQIL